MAMVTAGGVVGLTLANRAIFAGVGARLPDVNHVGPSQSLLCRAL